MAISASRIVFKGDPNFIWKYYCLPQTSIMYPILLQKVAPSFSKFVATAWRGNTCILGARGQDSLAGRALDSWPEGYGFHSRQEQRENFHLHSRISVLTLIQCVPTPELPQWREKDSGHCAKSAGARLQLNMHTPLTQRSCSGLTMLSRYSVGTHQGNVSVCWATVDWYWPKEWHRFPIQFLSRKTHLLER